MCKLEDIIFQIVLLKYLKTEKLNILMQLMFIPFRGTVKRDI
jgi:hypothetical protein